MRPTNVLLLLSDEHSRRVLGCYGNPVVRTPNLDALAARGTRFRSAYCQTPICVPSRASLATGRYAHTIDSWDNATPYVGTAAPSWGHRLTAGGHRVTSVGKLHYRRTEDPSGFPDQRIPMHVVEGVGDLYALLRGEMPARPDARKRILEAGPGESEYVRYDRAIAGTAARWLREEAQEETRPWVLFVGFVSPHFPLIVPDRYFGHYDPDALPLPIQWDRPDWPRHPVLDLKRRQQTLDEPFDEKVLRRAVQTYYGLVTFLDEQVGVVLDALRDVGLDDTTRVIYSTDHGEMLGEHGLWWKSAMYESAVTVPLIMAGLDIPRGAEVETNAMLVDLYPTMLEATGAEPSPEDGRLPGESLFRLAREAPRARIAFSEYHAVFSPSGIFMVRDTRYKYVYYVGYPPQLFDLVADPDERSDLASDGRHAETLARLERELRAIVDPEDADRRAKIDQRRRIEAAGGTEIILSGGVKVPYTPPPAEFPSSGRRRT
jgi:choline-sulfatase